MRRATGNEELINYVDTGPIWETDFGPEEEEGISPPLSFLEHFAIEI